MNAVQEYKIEGSYTWQGKENKFTGELNINSQGRIEGEIKDPNSRCPRHTIKGHVTRHLNDVVLEFVKMPTGEFIGALAPIEYQLKCREGHGSEQQDAAGKYSGAWRAANPEHCGSLAIGYRVGIGECVIWIPEQELQNGSTLTLALCAPKRQSRKKKRK